MSPHRNQAIITKSMATWSCCHRFFCTTTHLFSADTTFHEPCSWISRRHTCCATPPLASGSRRGRDRCGRCRCSGGRLTRQRSLKCQCHIYKFILWDRPQVPTMKRERKENNEVAEATGKKIEFGFVSVLVSLFSFKTYPILSFCFNVRS